MQSAMLWPRSLAWPSLRSASGCCGALVHRQLPSLWLVDDPLDHAVHWMWALTFVVHGHVVQADGLMDAALQDRTVVSLGGELEAGAGVAR